MKIKAFWVYDATLVRPVVSRGAEAWTLTKNEKDVLIFERKILRRIYEKGEWKIRTNRELEEMNERENMVK